MDRLILQKAAAYCAYQERTQDEVKKRLQKWNVWGEEADEIVAELIVQKYISEERFAKTYAGGKFRMKSWGKLKIKQELNRRGLSDYSIREGMTEIGDDAYVSGLKDLLTKKKALLDGKEPDLFKRKQKLARFAMMKGYESDLVWKMIGDFF